MSLDSPHRLLTVGRQPACACSLLPGGRLAQPGLGPGRRSSAVISLQAGRFVPHRRSPRNTWATKAGKALPLELVAVVEKNRLVRAVTVSFRPAIASAATERALALARSVGDALVRNGSAAGLRGLRSRRGRQRARPTASWYTERVPDNVVARITGLQGTVRIGPDDRRYARASWRCRSWPTM